MNNEYSNLLKSYGDLKQALHDLRDMPRRAQVRQLLPLVDSLAKLDFPITDLALVLTDAGVPFTASTLRAKLYYWRKKQLLVPSSQGPTPRPQEVSHHAQAVTPPLRALESPLANQASTNAPLSVNVPNAPAARPLAGCRLEGVAGEPSKDRPPLTKAAIREIRDSHIDLDALVRESRKRKEQQQT